MKHVSFEEYEAAKAEIIGGVHYIEKSTMENDVIHKTYSTEENGTFYEVNDKGRVEFWSDKHSESRIYDENERATETDKKAGPGYGDLLAEMNLLSFMRVQVRRKCTRKQLHSGRILWI